MPHDHLLALPFGRWPHDDSRPQDHDEAHRERDERFRTEAAARWRGMGQIPLGQLAILLGEDVGAFGQGPKTRMLIRAVKDGRLRFDGDLHRLRDGQRRTSLLYLMLDADDVRAWLLAEGSDDDRRSAAAAWAGFTLEA